MWGLPRPGIKTCVSCIGRQILNLHHQGSPKYNWFSYIDLTSCNFLNSFINTSSVCLCSCIHEWGDFPEVGIQLPTEATAGIILPPFQWPYSLPMLLLTFLWPSLVTKDVGQPLSASCCWRPRAQRFRQQRTRSQVLIMAAHADSVPFCSISSLTICCLDPHYCLGRCDFSYFWKLEKLTTEN